MVSRNVLGENVKKITKRPESSGRRDGMSHFIGKERLTLLEVLRSTQLTFTKVNGEGRQISADVKELQKKAHDVGRKITELNDSVQKVKKMVDFAATLDYCVREKRGELSFGEIQDGIREPTPIDSEMCKIQDVSEQNKRVLDDVHKTFDTMGERLNKSIDELRQMSEDVGTSKKVTFPKTKKWISIDKNELLKVNKREVVFLSGSAEV